MSAELKLSELMRGLDLNPGSATLTPAALFSIGRAISDQAKRAALTEGDSLLAEYLRWIDFFHHGEGDYDDFLKRELAAKGITTHELSTKGTP